MRREKTQVIFKELRSFWMPDYNYHYEIPEADLEAWSRQNELGEPTMWLEIYPIDSGEVLIGSLSHESVSRFEDV